MGKAFTQKKGISTTVLLVGLGFLLLLTIAGVLFQIFSLSDEGYSAPAAAPEGVASSEQAVGTVTLTIVDPHSSGGEADE